MMTHINLIDTSFFASAFPDIASAMELWDLSESEEEWEIPRHSEEDEQSEIDELIPEGYDFEFLDELSSEHMCAICLLGIRNPVQTATCGHRFCKGCLLKSFRKSGSRVCPEDRNPIPEKHGYFRDLAWGRAILSLHVKCKQNKAGCVWTGELRLYEEHFQSRCQYKTVSCQQCQKEMEQRFLAIHLTFDCPNRLVQCPYCNKQYEFCHTEVHEGEECAKFPLECPQKCGLNEIPREKVESHVMHDCPMTTVVCPYEGAGCTFKTKRKYLEAHIKQSTEDHLRKTFEELIKTKQKVERLERTQEKQNRTMRSLIANHLMPMRDDLDEMHTRLETVERNARNEKRTREVYSKRKKKRKRVAINHSAALDSDEE